MHTCSKTKHFDHRHKLKHVYPPAELSSKNAGGSVGDLPPPHRDTCLGLRDKLGFLHVLAGAEAAGPLLVHLGPGGDAVDSHVQHFLRPHDVRHDAVDVVEDAQDDVPLAQLFGFERGEKRGDLVLGGASRKGVVF